MEKKEYKVKVARFENGIPKYWKAEFEDENYKTFESMYFETEELANLGAQLFALSDGDGLSYLNLRLEFGILNLLGVNEISCII